MIATLGGLGWEESLHIKGVYFTLHLSAFRTSNTWKTLAKDDATVDVLGCVYKYTLNSFFTLIIINAGEIVIVYVIYISAWASKLLILTEWASSKALEREISNRYGSHVFFLW